MQLLHDAGGSQYIGLTGGLRKQWANVGSLKLCPKLRFLAHHVGPTSEPKQITPFTQQSWSQQSSNKHAESVPE